MAKTRRFNEVTIGAFTLGKMAELGRQLVFATDKNAADKMAGKIGIKPEVIQNWAAGYVAFDTVISVTGVLGIIQGIRKNRKGAGQAALVQAITIVLYSLYYLLYTLIGLKDASGRTKAINVGASIQHAVGGVLIYRFAQKALK